MQRSFAAAAWLRRKSLAGSSDRMALARTPRVRRERSMAGEVDSSFFFHQQRRNKGEQEAYK